MEDIAGRKFSLLLSLKAFAYLVICPSTYYNLLPRNSRGSQETNWILN
jgi:hypothetical protein